MIAPRTYTFFDTETTNMINFKVRNSDPSQPTVIQLGCMVTDSQGHPLHTLSCILKTLGSPLSIEAEETHGISKVLADAVGLIPGAAITTFFQMLGVANVVVGHNLNFDIRMIKILARKLNSQKMHSDFETILGTRKTYCTMLTTADLCKLPKPSGRGGYKWPKLEELYKFLFSEEMPDGHDAMVDAKATAKCFFELKRKGLLKEEI